MKQRVFLRAAGLLLALVLAALLVVQTACPGPGRKIFSKVARRFDREPRITVFIKETGAKKEMPIEEYIAGVVAGEMKEGWPLKAYAAQAIVARTFTMDFLARGGTRKLHGTDISTDEKEAQAYNAAAITPRIRRAVAMTRGKVITYRGRYVRGWFSASCGGRTDLAREGLAYAGSEPPYIVSVPCPEDRVIPRSEQLWSAMFTPSEIAGALSKRGKDLGTVRRVEIARRDALTGRAAVLRVVGTNGSLEIPGAELRMALGPQKMRSIWLSSIENTPQGIRMNGRGFGHGVGLCQWGAYALAESGKSPVAIVKYYYPKVQIMDLW